MSRRILIVDTYYPEVLKAMPVDPDSSYELELARVMRRSFGTADSYSRGLRIHGWETMDVIYNHEALQQLWARENDAPVQTNAWAILEAQAQAFEPDVVFMQDLNIDPPTWECLKAGQCSCPMPPADHVRNFSVLFTSFPHYLAKFENLGVRAVFNALAFDPVMLTRTPEPADRDIDVSFVGGVGAPSHWARGMETLEFVAEAVPGFQWWGYGAGSVSGPLKAAYRGEAWGLDMIGIYRRSKIVLNRHGEVAQGVANNMRMFEATGCGAMLLTEQASNLAAFFAYDEAVGYSNAEHAVDLIDIHLENSAERISIADKGQRRTLRDHNYIQRMKTVSDTLEAML